MAPWYVSSEYLRFPSFKQNGSYSLFGLTFFLGNFSALISVRSFSYFLANFTYLCGQSF